MRTGAASISRSGSAASAIAPLRLDVSPLLGTRLDAISVAEAIHAVASDMEASSDLHASASYRRRVAITLARRAVEQARTEAGARALKGAA